MSKSKNERGIYALAARARNIALASASPSAVPLPNLSSPSPSPSSIHTSRPTSQTVPASPPTHIQPYQASESTASGVVAYHGLKTALEALHRTSGIFPPLQSAVEGLIFCVKAVEHKAEYKQLVQELATLSRTLNEHLQASTSARMSEFIEKTSLAIQQEIKLINEKQNHGQARRLIELDYDEEIMNRYCRIKSLFQQLQADATLSIWSITNEHLANTRLEGLKPAKLAAYDSSLATEINRRTCTEDTRTAVLSNLNDWSSNSGVENIYWMNGMAGTGKTTIACTFADLLKARKQLAASFFCTRTTAECRDVTRIVPTISYQLARYSIPFQSALCRILGNDPDIGSRTVSVQFERLLKEPLLEVKAAIPEGLVVIIDALDECTNIKGVGLILDMLFRLAPGLPLKFFVASRPEPAIRNRMQTTLLGSHSTYVLHDIERSLVQADIELYLRAELPLVAISLVQQLAKRSGSLFIYAATAVRFIQMGATSVGLQRRLETMLSVTSTSNMKHAEIDELYTTILSAAFDNNGLDQEEKERMQNVLFTAVCAREPVNIETLAALGGIDDSQEALATLQPLHSVLYVSGSSSVVSTLHASFPEFLFDRNRSSRFFCDELEQNESIVRRCFGIMQSRLRFNICKLESSHVLDAKVPNLEERITATITSMLCYACRYWGDHLGQTSPSDGLLILLEEFLSERLLFWMEVMNLKRWMNIGMRMILAIKHWTSANSSNLSSKLLKCVEDARSFVANFTLHTVSRSTPHIYISALSFCPRSSFIYQCYKPRTKGLLELKGQGVEQWCAAVIATWRVRFEANCVALSFDDKKVAYGDLEGRVAVKDVDTGSFISGPFKGHGGLVTSVKFSPDGTRIASGSADCTILIRNVQGSTPVGAPLIGHLDWVTSVAFSADGKQLISGSKDNTIRIWDVEDSTLVSAPLTGHTGTVNSVAFSPDYAFIVSCSDDLTIRVWSTTSFTIVGSPFEGHTQSVTAAIFSPDGLWIISGSNDNTIRIWDAKTGTSTGVTPDDSVSISSLAVSRDGTQVFSSSHSRTILAWRVQDGDFVDASVPLEGHTDAVRSIALSSNGDRLVSCSFDKTIRVWDVANLGPTLSSSMEYTGFVLSLAFSPDGTRICTGSDGDGICLWDTETGTMVGSEPLEEFPSEFGLIEFSPDGLLIASGLADSTVMFLSTQSHAITGAPLIGHTGAVTPIAFSADGLHMASGSEDCTIRLWNTQDRSPSGVPFVGHTDAVKLVRFSPDGTHILSSTFDNPTIRVWNVQDGTSVGVALEGHKEKIECAACSPDCTKVVSGSRGNTLRLWNVQDGSLVHPPLEGHNDSVMSVAFSPDGTLIASGSFDLTVRVWRVEDGTIRTILQGHADFVISVTFSPSSSQVVSSSLDRTVRLWNLDICAGLSNYETWVLEKDGWITDGHHNLMFWTPPDLAHRIPTPRNPWVISHEGTSYADYGELLLGDCWGECYLQE